MCTLSRSLGLSFNCNQAQIHSTKARMTTPAQKCSLLYSTVSADALRFGCSPGPRHSVTVILIISFSIVYVIALVLLIKRKDFQPLKSRCVYLVFVSTLGNFLYFSSTLYNKILQNNMWQIWDNMSTYDHSTQQTDVALEVSCFFSNCSWWLFRAVWFVPYFFRSYRLKLIWGMQKTYIVYGSDDGEDGLREANLLLEKGLSDRHNRKVSSASSLSTRQRLQSVNDVN